MRQGKHTWGDRRSTTLKDVARVVGVSESTVSVVINGSRSGTRVSQTTREQVIHAAEALGYRPNALARALTSGRTQRIGIYSGRSGLDSRSPFFAELAGGVFEVAGQNGMNTLVHNTGSNDHMLIELVSSKTVDGLIVHAGSSDAIIRFLGDLRVPAVAVADPIAGLPSVIVDDHAGGRLQAEHLASIGHQRVLYLQSKLEPASALRRKKAFLKEAESRGFEVTVEFIDWLSLDVLSPSSLALLTDPRKPVTAVVCWNDITAEQACRRLDSLGMHIPADVAVVGYDGFQAFCAPRFDLTTIRCPWSEVGRTAAQYLVSLISGETIPTRTTLPVELILGATT